MKQISSISAAFTLGFTALAAVSMTDNAMAIPAPVVISNCTCMATCVPELNEEEQTTGCVLAQVDA